MATTFTDNSALDIKGRKFNEYAASLTTLLSKISENIAIISQGEMKGTAVSSLIESYENIKQGIENHIKRIDALGTVITQTAQGRAAIDSDANRAAQGTGA